MEVAASETSSVTGSAPRRVPVRVLRELGTEQLVRRFSLRASSSSVPTTDAPSPSHVVGTAAERGVPTPKEAKRNRARLLLGRPAKKPPNACKIIAPARPLGGKLDTCAVSAAYYV